MNVAKRSEADVDGCCLDSCVGVWFPFCRSREETLPAEECGLELTFPDVEIGGPKLSKFNSDCAVTDGPDAIGCAICC